MDNKKKNICLGVILDGNRRWSRKNNLSIEEGYVRGSKKLFEMLKWCKEFNVDNVVAYCFSTENWGRNKNEINAALDMIHKEAKKEEFDGNVKVIPVGDIEKFSKKTQNSLEVLKNRTKNNEGINLWALLSYGGRSDIVDTVNKLIKKNKSVTEKSFRECLSTKNMPYPDLIVRTGGAKRLSNFLIWESAYSEIYFINTLWPDFKKSDFKKIMKQFGTVSVNIGK